MDILNKIDGVLKEESEDDKYDVKLQSSSKYFNVTDKETGKEYLVLEMYEEVNDSRDWEVSSDSETISDEKLEKELIDAVTSIYRNV